MGRKSGHRRRLFVGAVRHFHLFALDNFMIDCRMNTRETPLNAQLNYL